SPKRMFARFSSDASASSTSAASSAGIAPFVVKARHASVEMVKPGGTGRPSEVISARPAPFPPRRSRRVGSPSALPSPNEKTNFMGAPLYTMTDGAGVVICHHPTMRGRNKEETRRSARVATSFLVAIAGIDVEPVPRRGDISATGIYFEVEKQI